MKWAFQLQEAEQIPPTAHHVLLVLADRYNPKFAAAWPSYADICRRTGLSERAVRNAIGTLEELGIALRIARLSSSGRKLGNAYRLLRYSHAESEERQSYDFDEHGKYDPELAGENLTDMGTVYDPFPL